MSEIDNDAPPEKTLDEQLQELKDEQAKAAAAQVDANVADLEKLIADAKAAEVSYADVHESLKDKEAQLKVESQTLTNALTAALGAAEITAVKDIVTAQIKVASDAENERNTAQTAADTARKDAAQKAKALEDAKAKLDTWRKPGASIDKRLKLAEGLITEIKKLRNGPNRGEAYWKLALGGYGNVPGQEFLNTVLERQPEVIAPDALGDRILEAWNGFRDARTAAATSNATLAAAEQALKNAEADFADKSKNLINAIAKVLAAREAASNAA